MPTDLRRSRWEILAVFVGRVIFAAVFIMALMFKLTNISGTASYIGSAGFPMPYVLAWLAVVFELGVVFSLLTGAFFSQGAALAAAYVLFLAFAFHGPSHWNANQAEFGFFVDHFTFIAGLLFAAAHGPGSVLILNLRSHRPDVR